MSEDIKVARNLAKLAKLLGDKAPQVEITKEVTREARSQKPDPTYEAEAVLKMLEKPARFMQKQCGRKECGEWFGTNYRAVAYCSINCRIKSLAAIGIQWDPSKKEEERWGGEPPLIIPPAALKALIQMAHAQEAAKEFAELMEVNDAVVESGQQVSLFPEPEQLEPEHMDLQTAAEVVHGTIDHFLPPPPTFQFSPVEVNFDAGL